MSKVIYHIDINAFYASAHMTLDPELVGKPIAVTSNRRGSVVTTASYEARVFGVQSAMPLAHAKRLCPQLIVVDVDFELYHDLSEQFIALIKEYTPIVEQASIDECYADMTLALKRFKKPMDCALEIQQRILNELGLPVSIGVGPNKFLAKMGSDYRKPLGISVMRIREIETTLWPMNLNQMHGIGKKTVPRLNALGIHTIADLAKQDPFQLKHILGNGAATHIQRANGYDYTELVIAQDMKSMGQSSTFRDGINEYDEVVGHIRNFAHALISKMNASRMKTRTIQLGIRTETQKGGVRSFTFDTFINDSVAIMERLIGLYDEFDGEHAIHFISVTFSNMCDIEDIVDQVDIFNISDNATTHDIIETLNQSLSKSLFFKASSLLEKNNES